jgi:hypothetical protein
MDGSPDKELSLLDQARRITGYPAGGWPPRLHDTHLPTLIGGGPMHTPRAAEADVANERLGVMSVKTRLLARRVPTG